MSCILPHQGIQLILAHSWTKPAILAAGKGRGRCFYAPAIFNVGAYSITAIICPSHPYVTKMVSVQYLLKSLVYWIQILYTGM